VFRRRRRVRFVDSDLAERLSYTGCDTGPGRITGPGSITDARSDVSDSHIDAGSRRHRVAGSDGVSYCDGEADRGADRDADTRQRRNERTGDRRQCGDRSSRDQPRYLRRHDLLEFEYAIGSRDVCEQNRFAGEPVRRRRHDAL
jgi:hypothetical protein